MPDSIQSMNSHQVSDDEDQEEMQAAAPRYNRFVNERFAAAAEEEEEKKDEYVRRHAKRREVWDRTREWLNAEEDPEEVVVVDMARPTATADDGFRAPHPLRGRPRERRRPSLSPFRREIPPFLAYGENQ